MGLKKNTNYPGEVPPEILEVKKVVLDQKTKAVFVILFFGIVFGRAVDFLFPESQKFSLGPFNTIQLIFLFLFVIYIIGFSKKINTELSKKGTNIKEVYNRAGDGSLFEEASAKGKMGLFNIRKTILLLVVIPFCCFMIIFGILALYLVFFKNIDVFLIFGLVALIVSLGVPFLFLFEDKRILAEARRRNKFVETAEKRWRLSKIIYAVMILIALGSSYSLIITNNNFVEGGTLVANGQIVYSNGEVVGDRNFVSDYFADNIYDCLYWAQTINNCSGTLKTDESISGSNFVSALEQRFDNNVQICFVNEDDELTYLNGSVRKKLSLKQADFNFESICMPGPKVNNTIEELSYMSSFDYDKFQSMKNSCTELESCYDSKDLCCIGIFRND
jgi:hypothetical protein